jgi:hypothetical protein
MNLKEIFLLEIDTFLSAKGFVKDKKEPSYHIKGNEITYTLNINISSKLGRYDFIPEFLVKSWMIAEVREGFTDIKFKGEHYCTVFSRQKSVAELYKKPEYSISGYLVDDEISLNSSLKNFKNFMNEIGFSFFDKFKTVKDFDRWFNEPLLNESLDFARINMSSWAIEGIIAAKFANETNYERIYNAWIQKLIEDGRYNKTIENLKSLKSYLDNY